MLKQKKKQREYNNKQIAIISNLWACRKLGKVFLW